MTIEPVGRTNIPAVAGRQVETGNTGDARFEHYRIQAAKPQTGGGTTSAKGPAEVTTEEREYFEQLFPASASEIKSYATYSPAGLRGAGTAGTLVDRRA